MHFLWKHINKEYWNNSKTHTNFSKKDLIVKPKSKESQFEAFLAIISDLLDNSEDGVYKAMLSFFKNIELVESDTVPNSRNCIFYTPPDNNNSTHYRAVVNGVVYDPYDHYQAPDTHGYCQMFALMLYIENSPDPNHANYRDLFRGLQKTDPNNNTISDGNIGDFDKYVNNTKIAGDLFLSLYNASNIKETFDNTFREKYVYKTENNYDHKETIAKLDAMGFNISSIEKPEDILTKFIEDFEKINQPKFIAEYVYDIKLPGINVDLSAQQEEDKFILESERISKDKYGKVMDCITKADKRILLTATPFVNTIRDFESITNFILSEEKYNYKNKIKDVEDLGVLQGKISYLDNLGGPEYPGKVERFVPVMLEERYLKVYKEHVGEKFIFFTQPETFNSGKRRATNFISKKRIRLDRNKFAKRSRRVLYKG